MANGLKMARIHAGVKVAKPACAGLPLVQNTTHLLTLLLSSPLSANT